MVTVESPAESRPVTFDTSPDVYHHWKLAVDGQVATLTLDIDEDAGIRPGYKLKLNSYDLGVDIEFHDALGRIGGAQQKSGRNQARECTARGHLLP